MKRQYLSYLLALNCVGVVLVALLIGSPGLSQAQSSTDELTRLATFGPAFTYQGYLTQNDTPLDGVDQCDMIFGLWDAPKYGTQLGSNQAVSNVDFDDGYFTVELNDSSQFGKTAFNGDPRWLQLEVRCPAGKGDYTTLGRQALTALPYAQLSHTTTALQGREIAVTTPQEDQVLKYNGSQWAPATDEPGYKRTVLVSPAGDGSDTLANGTALRNALNGITDAFAGNPYLLKIEPGVYNLGTTGLTMKPYVDIEGSGEGVTTITSAASTFTDDSSSATLTGANNAKLRFLTVENTGEIYYAIGIYNGSTAPRLTHVTSIASGVNANKGVFNDSASPTMSYVTTIASGGFTTRGVDNYASSPALINSTFSGNSASLFGGGISNDAASPTLTNCTFSGNSANSGGGMYNYSGVSSPSYVFSSSRK